MWGGRGLSNKCALFCEFVFALTHFECHTQDNKKVKRRKFFEVVPELEDSWMTLYSQVSRAAWESQWINDSRSEEMQRVHNQRACSSVFSFY